MVVVTVRSFLIILALASHALLTTAFDVGPPATVKNDQSHLSFCMEHGDNSTTGTTTLEELTRQQSRIVVVANFYTGCTGGRQEAGKFGALQTLMEKQYGDRIYFVTNLIQASTATNCAGWAGFSSVGETTKLNILYSANGDSAGSKLVSEKYFDNLHPQYMVIDGNLQTHYYESSDLDGATWSDVDADVYTVKAETECCKDSSKIKCDAKDELTYWTVGDCVFRGYDKVESALKDHMATLRTIPDAAFDWEAGFENEDMRAAIFEVGTVIEFQWGAKGVPDESHNVYKMANKKAFDACDFTDATIVTTTTSRQVLFTMDHAVVYFACKVGDHCEYGQKLAASPSVTLHWDDVSSSQNTARAATVFKPGTVVKLQWAGDTAPSYVEGVYRMPSLYALQTCDFTGAVQLEVEQNIDDKAIVGFISTFTVEEDVVYLVSKETCTVGAGDAGRFLVVSDPCEEPPTPMVGDPGTEVDVVALTCAAALGGSRGDDASIIVLATAAEGRFDSPRDLQWHPEHRDQLWVVNKNSADLSILHVDGTSVEGVSKLGDRAKYHYMASASSLSFGEGGRFATCQESRNTYDGKMGDGNLFMGPTLFDSDPMLRVTSMGEECTEELLEERRMKGEDDPTCFLRHIDMLHESPLCMGIAHDPETHTCAGRATLHRNVYWTFDGFGRQEQNTASGTPRAGMLMRYDFERDHGGCNGYLCADHSEAEVRRYEDVVLTRVPGVPSHIVADATLGHRDLYVADSGGKRLLRVDASSGRSDRPAVYDYPIYSSDHLHFNYQVYTCTVYETFVDADTSGLAEEDRDNFVPSGVALSPAGVVYVTNHATGNIIAVDKYTGAVLTTVKTGRNNTLAGLELHPDDDAALYVLDQHLGELLLVTPATNAECPTAGISSPEPAGRPRRAYPESSFPTECAAPSALAFAESVVGEPVVHDPGYMNIAIPFTYGNDTNLPCHDNVTGAANFNLDALLMAGHTCHRCLPEPCHNGGTCEGVQEHGFTCTCPDGYEGDLCQVRQDSFEDAAAFCGPGTEFDPASVNSRGDRGACVPSYRRVVEACRQVEDGDLTTPLPFGCGRFGHDTQATNC